MSNQKLENILNLALETPETVREKSQTLNVGFEQDTGTWELIVKYNGSLAPLLERGIGAEELIAGYGILTVPQDLVDWVAQQPFIEYVEAPKRLYFAQVNGAESACILPVTLRGPRLSGAGTLVAVIDSGIDYGNRDFVGANGESRILYLWDQSLRQDAERGFYPPAGFDTGVEFDREQISAAVEAGSQEAAYRLVPSRDVSGHGTAVAGIAAGGGRNAGGYAGIAPQSDLLIVKLGVPGALSFPRTTELMRALTYVVRKAVELNRPLAVNLSFGNTYGAHDGTSLLERFLDNISEIGKNVICVGAGNEGTSDGHVQGRLAGTGAGRVELAVSEYETALSVQLWKNYADQYRVTLRSPAGQTVELPASSFGSSLDGSNRDVVLEQTRVLIYYGQPAPYSASQELYFDLIPLDAYVNQGVWTFTLEPVKLVTGQYYFYLPSGVARNSGTGFFLPTPQLTLTIPSTSAKVVTVGAYDTVYDAYAQFSGRGYAYTDRTLGVVAAIGVKPDLVAPGVNVMAPDLSGGYAPVTGTSFATPFVTGAAALMMEWGIVQGNDPFLYGEKVKAYLRRGAKAIRGEAVYPNERVGAYGIIVSS